MPKTKVSSNWFFLPVAVMVAIIAEVVAYKNTKSDVVADFCAFGSIIVYFTLCVSVLAIHRAAQRFHLF